MTNWCSNDLTIKEKDKFQEVKDYMKSETSNFDFNNILPLPNKDTDPGKLWWTARNPEEVEIWINRNLISFETAWSPAVPVIVAIIKKFDLQEYEYSFIEESTGFFGMISSKDGKTIHYINGDLPIIEDIEQAEEIETKYGDRYDIEKYADWGMDIDEIHELKEEDEDEYIDIIQDYTRAIYWDMPIEEQKELDQLLNTNITNKELTLEELEQEIK